MEDMKRDEKWLLGKTEMINSLIAKVNAKEATEKEVSQLKKVGEG